MAALRTRGLNLKSASIAIGRSETLLYIAARRGTMSRTVGNSLEKMLGIKPAEYAPLQETQPDHDSSILQTDTHTILNHILVMAAELCYREREGKL